jgi:hypothetical protein
VLVLGLAAECDHLLGGCSQLRHLGQHAEGGELQREGEAEVREAVVVVEETVEVVVEETAVVVEEVVVVVEAAGGPSHLLSFEGDHTQLLLARSAVERLRDRL